MSRRSLPILFALLAAAGGAALWIAGGGLAPPTEISGPSDESKAGANGSDAETILDLSPVLPSAGAASETPTNPSVSPTPREPAPTADSRELEKAWWVEGRVIVPLGTPADEEVHVLALGHAFASSRPHRAPIRSDGSFRVPFPAGTSHGALRLDAKYLHLSADLWIAPFVDKSGIELHAVLGGCVRGRVLLRSDGDDLRSLLVGRRINVVPASEPSVPHVRESFPKAAIDDRLQFEVHGVPVGNHRVDISLPSFVQVGTNEVRVSPGGVHDVVVEFTRTVSISGIVLDAFGNPVGGARVQIDGRPTGVPSDQEGRFWFFEIQPGEVSLRASAPGLISGPPTTVVLEPGQSIEDVEVVVLRGATISGRVTDAGGNGRRGVVHLRREDSPLRSPMGGNRSELTYETGESGAFEFQGLEPGSYAAWVTNGRFRRTRSASGSASRSGIVVSEARSIDDIELQLPAAGRVSGRVLDSQGQAVEHAFVLARGADWEFEGSRGIPGTDSHGRFVIDDLPLGDVWISAVKESLVAPLEVKTTVREDGSDDVSITLAPGTRLRLQVDKSAEANDSMTVIARDSQGRSRRVRRAWTGAIESSTADPTYGPLPPGRYDIEATSGMGQTWRGSAELHGEEIVTVTMVLNS